MLTGRSAAAVRNRYGRIIVKHRHKRSGIRVNKACGIGVRIDQAADGHHMGILKVGQRVNGKSSTSTAADLCRFSYRNLAVVVFNGNADTGARFKIIGQLFQRRRIGCSCCRPGSFLINIILYVLQYTVYTLQQRHVFIFEFNLAVPVYRITGSRSRFLAGKAVAHRQVVPGKSIRGVNVNTAPDCRKGSVYRNIRAAVFLHYADCGGHQRFGAGLGRYIHIMGITGIRCYREILICSYRCVFPNRYRRIVIRNRDAYRSVDSRIRRIDGFRYRIYDRLDIICIDRIRFDICRTLFRLHRPINIYSCRRIVASIDNAETSVMFSFLRLVRLPCLVVRVVFPDPFGIFLLIFLALFRFCLGRHKIARLTAGRNGKSRRQEIPFIIKRVCAFGRYHGSALDIYLSLCIQIAVHNINAQ